MPCPRECPRSIGAGNHCCIVWCACLLWFISVFAIIFSSALILCFGDLLICTGTDVINALVLLCGLVMLPTNLHLLYYIAKGKKIRHNTRVGCCPLWMTVVWVIIISTAGTALCVRRIFRPLSDKKLVHSMTNYRNSFMHKRLMDNLQWVLKCCGFNSYKDWFTIDWYDKARDYEWPSEHNRGIKLVKVTDSVPLSCCKSGSCISNYLAELGTSSIHTEGCGSFLHRLIMISMALHIAIFVFVIMLECIILSCVLNDRELKCERDEVGGKRDYDVRQLMDIKSNFSPSSESYIAAADESDEEVSRKLHYGDEY